MDTLEEIFEIDNTTASSFEDFDFVIMALDETTVLSLSKVVGDFLPPRRERFPEIARTAVF